MARSFNGTSDYLEFTMANSYPVTMAAWFYANNITTAGVVVAANNFSGSDNDRLALQIRGDSAGDPLQLGAITDGGAGVNVDSTTGFSASTWSHGCTVCASATSRSVYLNGGSKATTTTSRAMTGLDRLTLGSRRAAGALGTYLAGRLAEVAVWNVALTDAEVALLATGLQPDQVRPASLRFYAPLVRDVFDHFGNALSASSGTSVADHPRIFR